MHWLLFPIDDLRQVVETAKGILMKEKNNRQLARQCSSNPFMSIKDNCNKKVTFDTWEGLEDKMDKLTVMMGKLAARDNGTNRQFMKDCPTSKEERKIEQIQQIFNLDGEQTSLKH